MYLLDTNHCRRAIMKYSQILNRLNIIEDHTIAFVKFIFDTHAETQRRRENSEIIYNTSNTIFN